MTQKILGPGGSRRRKRFWLVPMLLTVLATVFWVAGAQAVHDTGAFELDGNAASSTSAATPPDDWDRVCHQVTGTNCSTTFNTTGSYLGQTGAKAVSWTSDNLLNGTPSLDASIFTGRRLEGPDRHQPVGLEGRSGRPARQGQPVAQLLGPLLDGS